MPKVPSDTRRLTRAEAKAVGVSYSAKRRVDKSVKKVTKRTKLFTDRQVATAKKGISREAFTKGNIEVRHLKKGGTATEYKNLTKPNLFKLLRKYRAYEVLLKFHGAPGAKFAEYKGNDITELHDEDDQWFSAPARIEAGTLLDDEEFQDFLEESGVSGSLKYGLIVYGRVR